MSIATEIVTMKTVEGITKDVFVAIVELLEMDFHSKQGGFIDTELLYDEENEVWIMIQHWDSVEQLKAASKKMFHDKGAVAFVKALNPKSVKIKIFPQVKVWGK